MNGGQIFVIFWYAFRVVVGVVMDGKPLPKAHLQTHFKGLHIILNVAIGALILWWGGFWNTK